MEKNRQPHAREVGILGSSDKCDSVEETVNRKGQASQNEGQAMGTPGGGLDAPLDQSWTKHAYPGGDKGPQAYSLNQRWQHVKQDQPAYRNIDKTVQHPERDIGSPGNTKDERAQRERYQTEN